MARAKHRDRETTSEKGTTLAARATSPTTGGRRAGLVEPAHFVTATRDSGYRSTAFAVAELIDNAIQANAQVVDVSVVEAESDTYPISIRVIDDGVGMDRSTLGRVLAFGSSSRFNDRSSLGRYGMGLPNGPLSRARRVTVLTWRDERVHSVHLDVDEVVNEGWQTIPVPLIIDRPPFLGVSDRGTAVLLDRCDRLEHKRASTIAEHLARELARIYRRFLAAGLELRVNRDQLVPYDPLMLMPEGLVTGGSLFGSELRYELTGPGGEGSVKVRFSELPISRWHDLPARRKRELGVTNAPTVSILRANREIDAGWFFMGSKRRENYDDWWRCEVAFDPTLDELFGLTHAKQSITPTTELLEVLAPDLEPIARSLNARARDRFHLAQARTPLSAAERRAARAAASLPGIRARSTPPPSTLPTETAVDISQFGDSEIPHRVIVSELRGTVPYEVWVNQGQLVLIINSHHPMYRDLFAPLALSESPDEQEWATALTLLTLAAARAEVTLPRSADRAKAAAFRQAWGDVLATFLNSRS